ncbi:ABC transporter ATP-binding protein [Vibrio sp. 10N.261.51.F12]|uniref:ABC transporter ATP-binding protein n=1 Tax=Vibrio sp. 10N.261.51.F12 TaxID=3229679 RepID=UPI00355392AD
MTIHTSGVQITLNNITKTFADGTLALKPTDLSIQPGEILVLLGPSGCGKTTTLRLIAGLEFADENDGAICFGERDVTRLPIEQRKVGMVFQSYALFPNMNVEENIEYGLKVRGIQARERQEKLDEMLEMFDLQKYAKRGINQLSGGQKQRVALARAIITEPEVLLLDEPLSALDALLKQKLRGNIRAMLKKLGITAVYVTHDQEEAMEMGDRIAVLDHGEIAQIGSAEDIYLRPKSDFVADFIGQMNRFSGELSDEGLTLSSGQVFPIHHTHVASIPSQTHIAMMLRPEDIRFVASEGMLQGCVTASTFLGDRTRVMLSGVLEDELLTVDCFARGSYKTGQSLQLSFDSERLIPLQG